MTAYVPSGGSGIPATLLSYDTVNNNYILVTPATTAYDPIRIGQSSLGTSAIQFRPGGAALDDANSTGNLIRMSGPNQSKALTVDNSNVKVTGIPGFVAGDHYIVADAAGNLHASATGPAS